MDSKMRWCPKRMTHKRIQKWLPINLRIFQVTISPLIWQKYTKGEKGRVYSIVQPTVPLQKVEVPPWKNTFFWNEKSQRKVNLISAWIAWIKMIGEHRGQMTYYYARAAFASIKNFCFTDGKAENCSIFVPGGQGWQMTYSFVSLSKKPSWGLLDMCHAWAKKIINSFGFSHYIWRIWIVLMNFSVFIHRFYITINSFMHIIVLYVG